MKYLKFVAIIAILGIFLLPSTVFAQPPVVDYTLMEQWGPRAEDFLMKFYSTDTLEFEGLQAGEIDIVEWPLTKTYYDRWTAPPYNETIAVVGAGPEWGMYILDVNNNETLPDGSNNPCNDPAFRHALWHLVDRTFYAATIFAGMANPLWSPVAAAAADAWKNPATVNAHPFDLLEAGNILDANGYTINPVTNKRIDPETGLDINMKVYGRSDHKPRADIAERFGFMLGNVSIGYTLLLKDSGGCYVDVMENKDFNTYTGGWGLGVDVPDTLYGLFHSDMYWHPGWCPNYGHYSDDLSDVLLEGAFYAANVPEAITYVLQWQERYIDPEFVPAPTCVSNMIYHAHRRYYGQGPIGQYEPEEYEYFGQPWKGIVNIPGRGIGTYNNFWTVMNMYPEDPDGHNLCPYTYKRRWGWKVSSARRLNPIYGSWVWDWALMNWIYDSWIGINPFLTTEDKPWMAYQYDVGLWDNPDNPAFPKSTYVTLKIRNDVLWHDGTPMTMEDFRWLIGTEVGDCVPSLLARGCPYPWWYSSIADIHHADILDDQTIKIYFNVRSYLALHWIGGLPLIPKHIWQPLIADLTKDPTKSRIEPTFTGNGAYKFVSYAAYVGAVLTRNNDYFALNPVDVRFTEWEFVKAAENMSAIRLTLTNFASFPVDGNITVADANTTEVFYTGPYTIGPAAKKGQYGTFIDIIIGSGIRRLPVCTYLIISFWVHQPCCCWYDWFVIFHKCPPPTGWHRVARGWSYVGPRLPHYLFSRAHAANTIREDTNIDGRINIKDAVILGVAFAAKPGDLTWDMRADMYPDGVINVKDAVKLGRWFGWPNMCPD